MTRNHRFEDVLSDDTETKGKEINNMCDVLDRIEEKGKAEGEMKKAIEIAINMIKSNFKLEDIVKVTGLPLAKVQELFMRV